jgi:hypothetical protein
MATALYRKNGGEGLKYSEINQSFADADPNFFGVLIDPLTPDGTQTREPLPIAPGQARYGPPRQLGWAKIAVPATNTWRNATQAEIDLFEGAEGQDEQAIDAAQAREQVVRHPFIARVLLSLLRRLVPMIDDQNTRINQLASVVNQLTTQWETHKNEMGTTSLTIAVVRSRAAAYPDLTAGIATDLPDNLTVPQVAQVLRNDILDADAPRRGAP